MFRRSLRAQSLIEIVVGIGIIGVVFTSVGGLIFAALKSAKLSRERSLAQSLVNNMSSGVKSIVNYDWHTLWSSDGGLDYWSFDDGAGSSNDNAIAIDEISGNNGSVSLGVSGNTALSSAWQSSVNCKAGQCLDFDGTDDLINAGNSSSTQVTGDMSLSFWAYPTSLSGTRNIIGKNSLKEFNIKQNSDGSLAYVHGNGSTSVSCSVPSMFSLTTWTHVGIVRNIASQTVSFYKDGQPQTPSCGAWISVASGTDDLRIGYSGDGYFSGRIDEVRIYNQSLSVADISNLYSYPGQYYLNNNSGIWQVKHGQETSAVSGINFTSYFTLSPVERNSSNDIVASGGDNDPATKKASFVASWSGGYSMTQEEYVSRTSLNDVFTQTDWSGGAGETESVLSDINTFDTASSGIVFSSQGSLSAGLVESWITGGSMDSYYHWAWNDVSGWADLVSVNYATSSGTFYGIASTSYGGISMNCLDTSCVSSNYKVFVATTPSGGYASGDLYGYGWSDGIGWVSFNCDQTGVGGSNNCGASNYKVNVSLSTGIFTGYAWNDIIGWTSFNCSDLGVCATSDYKVVYNFTIAGDEGSLQGLVSPIFDTQQEKGVMPLSIVWQGSLASGTAVKFQLASSNSKTGPWNFVGSDGTGASYYPSSGSSQPNTGVAVSPKYYYNKRYLRYKVFLQTSSSATPTVNDISIIYNK